MLNDGLKLEPGQMAGQLWCNVTLSWGLEEERLNPKVRRWQNVTPKIRNLILKYEESSLNLSVEGSSADISLRGLTSPSNIVKEI